jgi:diguanylate cyclase (GGDEF)-like protein
LPEFIIAVLKISSGKYMESTASIKLKSIAIKNTRSTLLAYAIPMCAYSAISIGLGLTSTSYYYFLLCFLVVVFFVVGCILAIRKVKNFSHEYGLKLLFGQTIFWATIFPVWLLMLEDARSGGLLFALTMLIYTFSQGNLKLAITLNTFVVTGYTFCAYVAIEVLQQPGVLKHELLLVAAYLPVSIIIGHSGSKLAAKNSSIKILLSQHQATHQQLEATLKKLETAASTDELTGLINRRELNNRLSYELNRAKRKQSSMALMLLDLDHFKHINDTHGHHCGDLALKYVADFLMQHFRAADSVARWGGEEFVVLMPETALAEAKQVCASALTSLSKRTFHYNTHAITITASAGLCEMDCQTDPKVALHIADERLYIAKNNGRNQVIWSS